jgi:hypothetical protein
MGIGVVDVPVPTTEDRMALLARRCGPLGPSLVAPAGCSTERPVFDVLTGTPGVPTGVTTSAGLGGVRVAWTKGSPATRTLRRFLVTASSFTATNSLLGGFTTTREFTVSPDLRNTVLPLEAGDWSITVRECTDRGCGSTSPTRTVRSNGVTQISESDLARLTGLQTISPVGIFTMAAGRGARRGRAFPLQVSWGVWRHWKSLRELRLRMVGERGELGTIVLNMRSRRVTVDGPDSRARRGRLGHRGKLKAKRFTLRTRKARIVGSGPRGRLVGVELPLVLAKRLARQRVDVDVAASASDGKTQDFGPAGSFQVR